MSILITIQKQLLLLLIPGRYFYTNINKKIQKQLLLLLISWDSLKLVALVRIQKQLLLLLIVIPSLQDIIGKFNSKTTFVTVNLLMQFPRSFLSCIQKQLLLLLIIPNLI